MEPPQGFLVDEEAAIEHSMFLHQVFRRGHTRIRVHLAPIVFLLRCCGGERGKAHKQACPHR